MMIQIPFRQIQYVYYLTLLFARSSLETSISRNSEQIKYINVTCLLCAEGSCYYYCL
jgi:hypothetical protein